MKQPEHKKKYPIPMFAAAESLSRGKVTGAKRYLKNAPRNCKDDILLEDDGRFTELGAWKAITYPLDKNLKDALSVSFESGDAVVGLRVGEARLLKVLRLIDEDCNLTAFGRNRTIESLPLAAQCEALGIGLTECQIERASKRVEEDAAIHFRSENESVTTCEGGPFMVIIWCIAIAAIRELGVEDKRYLEALNERSITEHLFYPWTSYTSEDGRVTHFDTYDGQELLNQLPRTASIVTLAQIENCLRKDFNGSYQREKYPNLDVDDLLALFEVLTRNQIVDFTRFYSALPWHNRNGWPDLTIFDESGIRLVEVKAGDRLHYNQVHTIPQLKKIFPDLSVAKIKWLKTD